MHIEARHAFSRDLRVVKAALAWYPDSANMKKDNKYPLNNAVNNNYPTSVIKCLLRHGANPNTEGILLSWYYHMKPIGYLAIDMAVSYKKWVWCRVLIQHGAKITGYVKDKYAEAPAAERAWFKAWTGHRDLFAALIPELLERASYSYNVPPLEVKPGIIVPGRQGYQDSLNTFHAALWSNGV
jgi:hypothetical protein